MDASRIRSAAKSRAVSAALFDEVWLFNSKTLRVV
jgi:hypothetical protein